jgi:hypothetical protein
LCSFVQNNSGMGFIGIHFPFWFHCVLNSMVSVPAAIKMPDM